MKDKVKLVWNFRLQKTTTTRRPDFILNLKTYKKMWIQTICVQNERTTSRSRDIHVSCCIWSVGRWYISAKGRSEEIFDNNELLDKVVAMMQPIVLMDSESIIQKAMSGLIQGEDSEIYIHAHQILRREL